MIDPRATGEDLTAKARIRNAALDLFADRGEERVSLRAVAAAAGVTVGLVQHHFKTKEGLRAAVEQLVVDYFAHAVAQAPGDGTAAQIAAARDEAVRRMLETHPPVVNYVRRVILDPARGDGQLIERLTDLARREIVKLRDSGVASTAPSESTQVIRVMVRQLGQLLLQPMVDTMWQELHDRGASGDSKPVLSVTIGQPGELSEDSQSGH
ncbi:MULTISPECIES: TetR/AcrR family transcriptional regulator [Mycolicibacterium]|jgi:AcrR family transcriptional regulator|uniref:Transcriptional regulator n=1 Tax=Mycolicibacterium chubuense (strain NBB4) TaxID=710421 RepID=I4BSJ1_MYCCN|nr:TetR/AcrR family transcriptional regulator [Mycolicibacterium chubuense]AFM20248.1 transcriptional regulator [Mycolicibacterium chubuense NBB4]MBY0288417.1 TetR/AcrR family transcriptional regulator [Mycobacteriaceae bacterium]